MIPHSGLFQLKICPNFLEIFWFSYLNVFIFYYHYCILVVVGRYLPLKDKNFESIKNGWNKVTAVSGKLENTVGEMMQSVFALVESFCGRSVKFFVSEKGN